MDWAEARYLRGAVVLDRTGEPIGTVVGPYVMEGKLQGYDVDLDEHARHDLDVRGDRVVVDAKHVDRLGARTFRLDASLDEAIR